MCGQQTCSLADADPQNFYNLQTTDVDNTPSFFLSIILFLITTTRRRKDVMLSQDIMGSLLAVTNYTVS